MNLNRTENKGIHTDTYSNSLICDNNKSWLLNLNMTYKTLQIGAGSDLLISVLKQINLFSLTSLIITLV